MRSSYQLHLDVAALIFSIFLLCVVEGKLACSVTVIIITNLHDLIQLLFLFCLCLATESRDDNHSPYMYVYSCLVGHCTMPNQHTSGSPSLAKYTCTSLQLYIFHACIVYFKAYIYLQGYNSDHTAPSQGASVYLLLLLLLPRKLKPKWPHCDTNLLHVCER